MKPEIEYDKPAVASVIEIVKKYNNTYILCRRWISSWIDFIVLISILFIPTLLLDAVTYEKLFHLWFWLMLAYFCITELCWGRTLGKVIMGTVVVNKHGKYPNIFQVLIRNILRIFEANPFLFGIYSAGGFPAGMLVLMTKRKQRAGDMFAGTYVVLFKDLKRLQAMKNSLQ
jgi:uncharacterized RDD family membrane protein YckC